MACRHLLWEAFLVTSHSGSPVVSPLPLYASLEELITLLGSSMNQLAHKYELLKALSLGTQTPGSPESACHCQVPGYWTPRVHLQLQPSFTLALLQM